jgi:hypothetical protein
MVSLERLEEGEIYIINLSNPRLGENVFYIGTFVGVISRKKPRRRVLTILRWMMTTRWLILHK